MPISRGIYLFAFLSIPITNQCFGYTATIFDGFNTSKLITQLEVNEKVDTPEDIKVKIAKLLQEKNKIPYFVSDMVLCAYKAKGRFRQSVVFTPSDDGEVIKGKDNFALFYFGDRDAVRFTVLVPVGDRVKRLNIIAFGDETIASFINRINQALKYDVRFHLRKKPVTTLYWFYKMLAGKDNAYDPKETLKSFGAPSLVKSFIDPELKPIFEDNRKTVIFVADKSRSSLEHTGRIAAKIERQTKAEAILVEIQGGLNRIIDETLAEKSGDRITDRYDVFEILNNCIEFAEKINKDTLSSISRIKRRHIWTQVLLIHEALTSTVDDTQNMIELLIRKEEIYTKTKNKLALHLLKANNKVGGLHNWRTEETKRYKDSFNAYVSHSYAKQYPFKPTQRKENDDEKLVKDSPSSDNSGSNSPPSNEGVS